jgi:hypothetical protein
MRAVLDDSCGYGLDLAELNALMSNGRCPTSWDKIAHPFKRTVNYQQATATLTIM